MATVGLGLVGASTVVLIYQGDAPKVLEGFGFGAALLAMFMRVGGGIFTKAADVGADLVGKVEAGIPEDDPRNAATIADNVGDNVGDCAGMAADLFESYAVTLVAALILGSVALGSEGLVFPLLVPAIGAVTAMIGVFITRVRADESGLTAINRGFYISAVISAVLSTAAAFIYLPQAIEGTTGLRIRASLAVIFGIVLAGVILWLTGHFTGTTSRPTRDVARTSLTGPATVILAGIGVGLESAVYTAVIIGAAVYGAFLLGGGSLALALFFVALAGCGLLTTVGVIVAMDTFGPVSDNAQGIAEMSHDVDEAGARILTDLDAVGNTTKAITKGIAIATAVLAATALFGSYQDAVATALVNAGRISEAELVDLSQRFLVYYPSALVGLLLGASVVFLFSGLAINAVTRAAGAIIFEVRRQIRDIPGIMEGTAKPEYGKVVDICTRDSLRELATPGLLAALTPIAVGFALGVGALAGFLAGAIGDRMPDGGVPRQLRWVMGQRQEDRRGRHARRQGQRRPCGHGHRRHRRRPVQGHGRPRDQPAHQGDEPGVPAHRPRDRRGLGRVGCQPDGSVRHRGGCGADHRGGRRGHQAPRPGHHRRRRPGPDDPSGRLTTHHPSARVGSGMPGPALASCAILPGWAPSSSSTGRAPAAGSGTTSGPGCAQAGQVVYAPSLQGVGRPFDEGGPDVALSTHIDQIVRFVEDEGLDQVILVGFSYGGYVITGAADRLGARIARLVYVDAFVPTPGRSFLDLLPERTRTALRAATDAVGHGQRVPPAPLDMIGGIGELEPGVSEQHVDSVLQRRGSHPMGTYTEPFPQPS